MTGPQVVEKTVILTDLEVDMARSAVKRQLTRIRSEYRRLRRLGDQHAHYATRALARFDGYLDLFERLGGDPDSIRDAEDGGS